MEIRIFAPKMLLLWQYIIWLACISISIKDIITTKNNKTMIKIFGMKTCPDCAYVEEQVKGNGQYEIIDIGAHVSNLKEFMRLRDNNPALAAVKRIGAIGIPCFVLEDGTVTLRPEKAGLHPRPKKCEGASCNIDGSGC